MSVKNGIIRIWRTPGKTIFFFVCILLSEMIFSLGMNLWVQNDKRLKAYDKSFTTIGTAEQAKTGVRQVEQWDAEAQEYKLYQIPTYNRKISDEVLKMEGVQYIDEPETRAYYRSDASQYELQMRDNSYKTVVLEFEPVETCLPNHSVPIKIKRVLTNEVPSLQQGNIIWFCNHGEPQTENLEMGQTYVACLIQGSSVHGEGLDGRKEYEYQPFAIKSSQSGVEGGKLKEELEKYYKVENAFYHTEIGKCYEEIAKAVDRENRSIPVTETGNTELLMAFYKGEAYITVGEDISKEEYEAGDKVCLVPQDFAKNNNLKTGDKVEIKLYAAYYGMSARSSIFMQGLLNASGKMYPVFEKGEYKIKGIYDAVPDVMENDFGVARNEIIIPEKSVECSDNNIALATVMSAETTSFSIPNGTIDKFMEKWSKVGAQDLNITFYDGGYSQFERGLSNMRIFSGCLAVIGGVMICLVLFLYSYIYVMQQRNAIIIERLLGVTKRQSMISMCSGAFLVLGTGSVLGGIAGAGLFVIVPEHFLAPQYFNMRYTYNAIKAVGGQLESVNSSPWLGMGIGGIVIILGGMLLIMSRTRKGLQTELIQSLGKNEWD